MVPVSKGKGCKDECSTYRSICLLNIPEKVCGRLLVERVMDITECRVSNKKGGFRRGIGYVNQIFVMKGMAEKYVLKDRKLYAAFMD